MELIQLALDCGAYKAELLPVDNIVLNAQFREICKENACGNYGRCYMCPPDIGPVEELMKRICSYKSALLYQTVSPLEDSYDLEGMVAAARKHTEIGLRLQERMKGSFSELLHLSCGCNLCDTCAKLEGIPCRWPNKALKPMEGYGIDVYQTVQATKLAYVNGQNTVTYFGVVLFMEELNG